ncbi:Protein of unknown function [Desulfuromusa kysingii]|uniref:DUF2959 domain-containing protein n=1 Tax=Desulfuromusa kysingii TaxID=37625 RepID=A0A1H3W4T1_9BACT|nr:DUF2959 domain-containing protein [Desulfuromusa kysingii]SDZ82010.1 Protein of unknown function [Desulfuromusa kysingii]
MLNSLKRVTVFALIFTLTGCSGVYYGAMEKIGVHKRDILVDRVIEARDSQQATKEQFASALENFNRVVNFQGGELEDKYRELKKELDASEDQADEVHNRINAVKDVAEALFAEWEGELELYNSASLRQASEKQLKQTKTRYNQLIGAMRKAESTIAPVLNPLRDQVLFLKHNLNARAVASLQAELTRIEVDVSRLIRDMEIAMDEADRFIQTLQAD